MFVLLLFLVICFVFRKLARLVQVSGFRLEVHDRTEIWRDTAKKVTRVRDYHFHVASRERGDMKLPGRIPCLLTYCAARCIYTVHCVHSLILSSCLVRATVVYIRLQVWLYTVSQKSLYTRDYVHQHHVGCAFIRFS